MSADFSAMPHEPAASSHDRTLRNFDLHLCLISFGSADVDKCIISYGLGFFLLGKGNCAASLLLAGLLVLDSSYASGEGAAAG